MADEAGWSYWSVIPRIKPGSIKGLERSLGGDFDTVGRGAGDKLGRGVSDGARRRVAVSAKSILAPLLAGVAAVKVKDFIGDSLGEARESQKVGALTTSIIKSTGGAAKVTAKQVGNLATAISNKTGVDDEQIQAGANLLLTFKNVKREGSGLEDVFGRATTAAADLSAAGFGDITGTAKQLGKALNDPLKGISALGRAGVTFTEGQKKQIKALVEQNDLLGAQQIILGEVESQVGGAAAATSTLGEKSSVAWANIKEGFGTALLPLVDDMQTAFLEKGIPAAEDFVGWFQKKGVPALREFGDEVGPLAKSALPAIGSALRTAADGAQALAGPVKSLIDGFNSLPKAAQTAILLGAGASYVGGKTAGALAGAAAAGSGGKGGKTPVIAANPAVAIGAAVTLDGLGKYSVAADTFKRLNKDMKDSSSDLAKTFDKDGRATADSVKAIKARFEEGRIGKYAADLGVDLDKLAKSFANSGLEGKYVQEVLADLEGKYSKSADAFDDAFGFVPGISGEGESSKIAGFTNSLRELGDQYTVAGDKAYKNGNQVKDLSDLMFGGAGQADKLARGLNKVGKTDPSARISTPGMGAAIGSAGTLLSQLNAIDGKRVRAIVSLGKTGVNLGNIIGQLNAINEKKSGGGRVRGFDAGGWTGPGSRLNVAGLVHADEFVVRKSSRQQAEKSAPGALDTLNRTGEWPSMGGTVAIADSSIAAIADAISENILDGAGVVVDSQAQYTSLLERTNR